MTPDAIMAAFEGAERLPADALRAAGDAREIMVPVFLDYIGRLQSAGIDDLEGMDVFVFMFFMEFFFQIAVVVVIRGIQCRVQRYFHFFVVMFFGYGSQ